MLYASYAPHNYAGMPLPRHQANYDCSASLLNNAFDVSECADRQAI